MSKLSIKKLVIKKSSIKVVTGRGRRGKQGATGFPGMCGDTGMQGPMGEQGEPGVVTPVQLIDMLTYDKGVRNAVKAVGKKSTKKPAAIRT